MQHDHELAPPAYATQSLSLASLTSDQRIASARMFIRAKVVRNDAKAEIRHQDVLFTGRPPPVRRPARQKNNGRGKGGGSSIPSRALVKRLELYSIRSVDFGLAERLHELWLSYAKDSLGTQLDRLDSATPQQLQQLTEAALRLDLTGARLLVVDASTASQVGICGICLMETKLSFRLAKPPQGRLLTIPKVGTTLRLELGAARLTLFASQLTVRPAERATKRFRSGQRPAKVHFDSLLEKAAADAAV